MWHIKRVSFAPKKNKETSEKFNYIYFQRQRTSAGRNVILFWRMAIKCSPKMPFTINRNKRWCRKNSSHPTGYTYIVRLGNFQCCLSGSTARDIDIEFKKHCSFPTKDFSRLGPKPSSSSRKTQNAFAKLIVSNGRERKSNIENIFFSPSTVDTDKLSQTNRQLKSRVSRMCFEFLRATKNICFANVMMISKFIYKKNVWEMPSPPPRWHSSQYTQKP